jgi:hypothetical protein
MVPRRSRLCHEHQQRLRRRRPTGPGLYQLPPARICRVAPKSCVSGARSTGGGSTNGLDGATTEARLHRHIWRCGSSSSSLRPVRDHQLVEGAVQRATLAAQWWLFRLWHDSGDLERAFHSLRDRPWVFTPDRC